ncbi:unnamed protein product [Rotaria sp. Silwood1]|nr:unnamed protein product [Rotaria sp. Silwood1]CAF3731848.1 unnamed protein product [Rotaria sp. Silwood1]CAF3748661.1 unnamed protein product [Rotaria sp. Silwood1]CAF3800205.1 unnamed protein product [Rotaria sp. Silwood1]
MCTKNNPSLNIAALGRPFQLGMLYDYRSDKLIPDISVWESDPSSQHISWQPLSWKKCELYMTDTFTEKADLLNIDNNLKLSVLANLVKLSRSEKLIDDRNQTNHVLRFILKYSVTKNLHALTMTNMKIRDSKYREVLDQKIATHIVTDIVYGGDIFFVLDRTLSNDEDRTDIENRIKQFLIKFETFQVLDNGTLNWNYHEKELAQTLRCQYYGDFPTDSNPRTFEEIVKLYKHLLKSTQQLYDIVVIKQVRIYPLYLLDKFRLAKKNFHQINDLILIESLKIFDNFYRFEVTLYDLKSSLSFIRIFYRTEEQILIVLNRLSDIENNTRNEMMKLLPKIRAGFVKETALTKLLSKLDLSPCNQPRLTDWIQFKREEINIFKDFMNDLRKQDNIRQLARPFAEVQKNYASQSILRLIIHVTAKNDLFLKEILQCLDGNIKELTHQYTTQDFWFNDDNLSLIMNRIRLFIKFAELNNSQPNFEFIVNEEYADEFQMNKGVTCLLYENSVATNFEIPSKPGRPIATKVSDCNVTLHWAKPIYGSQHIQHYKIYSKCIMPNSKWKLLLSTTDAKTSVNIPHLRKRKYQFKIQGTTLVGDTIESDASDIIG